jgi:3-hydroxyisobutyrate dehydrogenase-like beta-hydroxyacid dehydrogenase
MGVHAESIGFLGLGEMGGPMVANLLRAGYRVHVFDLIPERVAPCRERGAVAADSVAGVTVCPVVMASLPSSESFVKVASETLLPHARAGQIIVDLGTTTPPETRRLAAAFAERGATLLDVPVSGGPEGAKRADLYMFAGGDEAGLERVRPMLTVIGGADKLTYCGASGAGQIVKGVNQLMMGLGNAAYLEALAFGVRAGIDAAVIERAIGANGRWRADFSRTAAEVAAGGGARIGVKFRELPYYLREARESGVPLPLTEALYAFCEHGERVTIDDHRPAPSFWHELLRDR